MGLCCWRDCSALANDHLHSCHTRSQDQHWPPFPFQAGHHCSPAFCQCTCVPECISAFPIGSPKTAFQYLDYEGRVNFHHSRGHGQTVWVMTSPPIRGAGDHDSLSAGSLLTTIIWSMQITNPELHAPPATETWGDIISRQSGNQETLILDSELLQPVWKRGNFDSQYFASL